MERQLDGVTAIRAGRTPVGLVVQVALERASQAERDHDPATRAAWRWLTAHAPLGADELAVMNRFWMARDTYQQVSPVQTRVPPILTQHVLTRPKLQFAFTCFADPAFWEEQVMLSFGQRLPAVDFTVGGRRYGVYLHDWRGMTKAEWVARIAARGAPHPPTGAALDREAFARAVRAALRDFSVRDRLRDNPLVDAARVRERAGPSADRSACVPALAAWIESAVQSLRGSPRTGPWHLALERTYLRPAPSQNLAAEQLGFSFGSYRRYLAAGIADVIERLWQDERTG
jgi:hypothetical protein